MSEVEDTLSKPRKCHLLNLPIELKERIYRFVLVAETSVTWPAEHSDHRLGPALLATCRQINQEAAPILYRCNSFTFTHPSDCNVFRHIMDTRNVQHITQVSLRVSESEVRPWLQYLSSSTVDRSLASDLPGLQSLTIYLPQNGRAHGIDIDNMFNEWHRNKALLQICRALEGKTSANVNVLLVVRIWDDIRTEHIRVTRPLHACTTMGTNIPRVCHAYLELDVVSMAALATTHAMPGAADADL